MEASLRERDKLSIHRKGCEWIDAWGLIRNDGPNNIYLLFKSTNPATRIGVSNLKYEIEKANLAKSDNNVKYLIDDTSSNK